MSETNKPRLFALLVGINNYIVDRVGDLRGCVADVERMEAYLKEPFVLRNFEGDPQIKVLTDGAATKAEIIKGFSTHLSKAKKGDSILFYFSGHGMREKTNIKAFTQDEIDGNLASIVCVDSDPWKHKDEGDKAPLSDKELRFQLHELDKIGANIVTIFDCCHSGENTRSMEINDGPPAATRQLEKRAFPARSKSGFKFNGKENEILTHGVGGKNLASILPEAKHVQMAACKEVELAKESPRDAEVRSGVFTSALLDVLTQFEGNINYDDLYLRVLNRMTNYLQSDDAQTPQMYIKTDDPKHRYKTFLTNGPSNKLLTTNVVAGGDPGDEEVEREWRITSGSLQGIPFGPDQAPTEVLVKSTKSNETWKASVQEVFPGHCIISFEGEEPSKDDATLYGQIAGLGIDPLNIFITGADTEDEEGVSFAKKEFAKILDEAEQKNYKIVEEEEGANYTLVIKKGVLFCTKPFKHDQEVVQGIAIKTKGGEYLPRKIRMANEDLNQMATWHFLKGLEHSEEHDISSFTDEDKTMYPVEFSMYVYDEKRKSERRLLPNKFGVFAFDLTERPHYFRLQIENHSDSDYYCSLITLSDLYGADVSFMNHAQLLLGPGNENSKVLSSKGIPKGGQKYLKFSLKSKRYDYVRHYNQDSISFFFKLIVSANPFSAESLAMPELPFPKPFDKIELPDNRGDDSKSLSFFEYEPEQPEVLWEIHSFELVIQNPDLPELGLS